MTIADRITKKQVSVNTDKKKITNLQSQIAMYQRSVDKSQEAIDQKTEEIELLQDIKREALVLVEKLESLTVYTDELRNKFLAIEWTPDLAWEDKLESTDYHEKIAEKFAVVDEIEELVRKANKIYYRR